MGLQLCFHNYDRQAAENNKARDCIFVRGPDLRKAGPFCFLIAPEDDILSFLQELNFTSGSYR
jgi:hypothetical protein